MKLLKFALLALGFYLLYLTVQAVGVGTLVSQVAALGWKFLPVLLFYPFIYAFHTLGWAYSFPKSLPKHVPFRDLYAIRIVGETLNAVIPWAASVGGEPIKAELLKKRHGIPLADGLASILIVHTTFWVSLNVFVIGGIIVTLNTLRLTPVLWQCVLAFLIVLGIGGMLLFAGLQSGIFKWLHRLGDKFKWWGLKSEEKKLRFAELDSQIRRFYVEDKKRFFLSVFFNLLGWLMGVLETYWIAKILGMDIGLAEAWLFEALMQVLRIGTFFIPSSIGAQEGGIVLILLQLGYEKTVGGAFAIVRRLREIFWLAAGLFLWSLMQDKPEFSSSKTKK